MAPGFEDATSHCATSAAIARSDAKEHAVASDSDDSEGSEAGGTAWLHDLKLDSAWRAAMVLKMRQCGRVFGEEEIALIWKGCAILDMGADTGEVRMLRHSPTIMSAWTKHSKKGGRVIGRVELLIRASPEEIIAEQMHFDSKIKLSRRDPKRDRRYEILEVKNVHHIVVLYEAKLALGFANRTFLQSLVWRKTCDAPPTYIWVNVPIDRHERFPPEQEAHAVRATASRYFRLTEISEELTHMDFACSLDLQGAVPKWVADRRIPHLMRTPYDLQIYFLQLTRPSKCIAEDGTCIGHMVMHVAEAARRRDRASAIRSFIMRTAMLRKCKLTALDAMLIGIFAKKAVIGGSSRDTPHDPAALTAADAENIGRGLMSIVRVSSTHIQAVDELVRQHPSLGVTAQQHAWFRPMLETIAKSQR